MTKLAKVFRGLERRLGFLPFSPFFFLVQIAVRQFRLKSHSSPVGFARLSSQNESETPRDALIWLVELGRGAPAHRVDACMQVPSNESCAMLPGVFSAMMTSSRLQSMAFYFDERQVASEWRLLGTPVASKDGSAAPVDIPNGLQGRYLKRLFLSDLADAVTLPVGAKGEAQLLLKRLAGGAQVVCLNLGSATSDPGAFAYTQSQFLRRAQRELPDIVFLVLDDSITQPFAEPLPPHNVFLLHRFGLTLHERMAVVQAADLYVGAFDLLAVAAVAADRDLLVYGAEDGVETKVADAQPVLRRPGAVWYPRPADETVFVEIEGILSKPL